MTPDQLKILAHELGFSGVGVCSADAPVHLEFYREWLDRGFAGDMVYLQEHLTAKSDVKNLLPSCQSVIAVALDYNQEPPRGDDHPKIARYALGRDYHRVLKKKLKALQKGIESQSAGAEFRICVDTSPVFEREYGHLAGLGWFGKNTCLIDSKRGSWFFIGILLTSLSLETDSPSLGGCGTCRQCVDACPTGAILMENGRWQIDSRSCISYLTIENKSPIEPELADRMDGWTFGCDICQEVCPFNTVRPSQPDRGSKATDSELTSLRDWPSLLELTQITFDRWDQLTRGSAVRRAGWEGIKRNAQANLIHLKQADKPKFSR